MDWICVKKSKIVEFKILYDRIDECIDMLVKSRLYHSLRDEAKAVLRMESVMVEIEQFVGRFLEEYDTN